MTFIEGTIIEDFPKEIGKWEGDIDGYQVKRETSAKEIEDEVYIVTFTENWSKGTEKDFWTLSYKVERGGGSEKNDETGNMPPYYENN